MKMTRSGLNDIPQDKTLGDVEKERREQYFTSRRVDAKA